MGEITTITKATQKSKSLRTTIPVGISRQFNLAVGDKLNWEIKARDQNLVILVTPIRLKSSEKNPLK